MTSGVLAIEDMMDEYSDTKEAFNSGRRSATDSTGSQIVAVTPVVTPVTQVVTPVTGTDSSNCLRTEQGNLEFRNPYLFMLKPSTNDKNNDYNYRLISNIFLNDENLKEINKRYLYIFGLLPCKYIPSAYIPLNRKKLSENNKRLDTEKITDVFQELKVFNDNFQKKIKQFMNKSAIYNNLNLSTFGIILIIYWSLVLLILNYVVLYYYGSSFNNILATILFILLLFSIIWKMIYTVQN
jgi:hypothetical protein